MFSLTSFRVSLSRQWKAILFSDCVINKSWYGIENSFLQKDAKLNNSSLKLSAHVEPDGNNVDTKDTHINDSINEGN